MASRFRTVILNYSGVAKIPVLQECGAEWLATFRRIVMPSSWRINLFDP